MFLFMCRWLLFLPRLLPLLLLSRVSYGETEVHINNASDFITFSNDVNRGNHYSGTTILLDNDLDFTGETAMEPIGKDGNWPFRGTFDGKGHVIRGLQLSYSSSESVGLFGYSEGSSIANLVIDSSCSITSSSEGTNIIIGSLIGLLKTINNLATVENIVNMASVTFSGDITNDLHLGGIVGAAWYVNHNIVIKNCANYGTVTHNGIVNGYCDIGGIVGHFIEGTKYLQNCVNYGAINHTGSTSGEKYIGGIAGLVSSGTWSLGIAVENCLSVGKIELNNNTNSSVGGIAGNIGDGRINITHCFWTNDTGSTNLFGKNNNTKVNVSDSHLTELNTATLNELNDYAANKSGFARWALLRLNGGRINDLTQDTLITIKSHLPNPVKEGNTFLFWCEDLYCNVQYNTTTPSNVSEVYAIWNTSTLTFDFGNGTVLRKEFQFNEKIEYPEDVAREGYTFDGWNPEPTKMPGADLTIAARWVEVPVISSSSIESSSSSSSIESISSSSSIESSSYSSFSKSSSYSSSIESSSSSSSIESISSSSSIESSSSSSSSKSSSYSSSIESSSSSYLSPFVEVVFGKKDLTREEIKEIIKQYTGDDDFSIEKFENNEDGTIVIVKFTDAEKAESFVEKVRASSEIANGVIKNVDFISGEAWSFSLNLTPLFWCSFLVLP